ncbi:hypothetical protein [Paraburkholderia caribensis]|uniref:hypothetical protein n=1 Tax=Paraburkholderia caribensis TaxID=75105 RepID=UPI00286223CF|nr:hypothetical protein [Paraburkholderia caribensis]MDR6381301.1 hypothetical protein [Paraburkholderia caribensis]
MMTRRATVFARAEVTRIVNEAYVDWRSRADRDALLSFLGGKMVRNRRSVNHVPIRSISTAGGPGDGRKKSALGRFFWSMPSD